MTPPLAPPAASEGLSAAQILALIAAFVLLVAGATVIWGLPALAMTALALVPVVFTLLMMVTRG